MAVETISVEEAGRLLGCGRSRVFELLADGTLERAPRYGRSVRIFRVSVDRALTLGPRKPGRRPRAPAYLPPPLNPDAVALDGTLKIQR